MAIVAYRFRYNISNFFLWLTSPKHLLSLDFITRLKKGASFQIQQTFTDSFSIRDRLIKIGSGTEKTPYVTLRLVEIKAGKIWYSYLTSTRRLKFGTPI